MIIYFSIYFGELQEDTKCIPVIKRDVECLKSDHFSES